MHVVNSLLPVFLMIGLGKALCRTALFPGETSRNLNRLTYWIALPALLLDRITGAVFDAGQVWRLTGLLVLATLLSALLAWVVSCTLRLPRQARGAFIQGSARANNAFVGLPVILYALSEHGPAVEALATVSLAPAIVFYNVFSVSVLLAYSEKDGLRPAVAARLYLKQLITNPLILSCVIGLVLNRAGMQFPVAIQRSLATLGNAALALALLSIGSTLSFKGLGERIGLTSVAASIKVFAQPLIGLGLALLWAVPAVERQILLIYLACPTAVVSFVMADMFGSDRDLAAHIIVLTTLLSALSLLMILTFS